MFVGMARARGLGFAFASAAALCAQSDRALSLPVPASVGGALLVQLEHPVLAAGNPCWFLLAPRYVGSQGIQLLPFQWIGSARLDVVQIFATFGVVLDASGSSVLSLAVPNDPWFAGIGFDVQAIDLHVASDTLSFSRNDLQVEVLAAAPVAQIDLVAVPAGTFSMGSAQGSNIDQPVHTVTISRPFWIGRTEVTQAQFVSTMGHNPSRFQGTAALQASLRPVDNVSFEDAADYCARVDAIERAAGRVPAGYAYRLPTEAEWEYCCRAGTTTAFAFGSQVDCSQANIYNENANGGAQPAPCVGDPSTGNGQTWVSSFFAANAFGLHSMHGNVAEWVLDGFPTNGIQPYSPQAVTDPVERSGPLRMVRGGSWWSSSVVARSSYRAGAVVADLGNVGFRLALAPILP